MRLHTVTYDLSRQYKTFKAVWGLRNNDLPGAKNLWVNIYGDGALLFTTPSVTNGSAVKPFSVNVSGVQYLKFELCSDYEPSDKIGYWQGLYGMFDPILYR
jgi:hypothetical protein